MTIYQGYRTESGAHVEMDGFDLDPELSLHVRNHSPTGFEWGYGGSGPAQLALAILMNETDLSLAVDLYERFKWDVVSKLARERWTLTSVEVHEWIHKTLAEASTKALGGAT